MMKYLTVDKKERPINFGWGALELFEELTGISGYDWSALQKMKMKDSRMLIYSGFVNGAEVTGKEVDFNPDDVKRWLNEDMSLLESVMEIFIHDMAPPETDQKKKEEDPEKNH